MMGKTHYAAGALFAAAGAPLANHAFHLGLSPAEMTVGVGIGMIAGVLPDIDHPDSLVTKGLLPGRRMFGGLGRILGWWLSIPPRFVGVGARAAGNHRGPTHTIGFLAAWTLLAAPLYAAQVAAAAFLASIVLNALSSLILVPLTPYSIDLQPGGMVHWLIEHTPAVMPLVMLTVGLGYLAHLVTDSMTKVPIPFWWPILPLSRRFFFPLMPKSLRVTTDGPAENRLIRPIIILAAVACYIGLIGIPLANQIAGSAKQEAQQLHRQVKKADRAKILAPLKDQGKSSKR